jgi:hypothetical protein
LNPVTNDVYISSANTTVITQQNVEQVPLTVSITPLSNNQTSSTTPTITLTPASAFSPEVTTPDAVYFQVDTWMGTWTAATAGAGGAYTATTGTLQPGMHVLYAYATDGQDGSSTQGQGELSGNSSPIIGSIAAYWFLVTGASAPAPGFSASPSPVAFGNQTEGATSKAVTLTVTNSGNAGLNITSVVEGGTNEADFTVSSDMCNASTVTAGNTCTISVSFTASTATAEMATLTFTDNASGSPQVVNLTGTGVAPVPTATTTALAASATSVSVGTSVTLTATVTPASGTPTPTGTVMFKDGATTLGPGTLNGSGVATYSASALALGSHTMTASYGGDTRNIASASGPVTVTVTAGATTTALTASASSIAVGASETFTATVSGASGVPAATGAVTFMNGTTTLGMGTLSSGTATYTTSSLTAGSYSVTAAYAGDANNAASTSTAVTVTVWPGAPSFSLALSPSSGTFKAGTPATTTVTITSINGFASATTLSCSGLPKNSVCDFSASSITPAVSGTATSTLTIKTDTTSTTSALDPSWRSPDSHARRVASRIAMANIVGALLLLPLLGSKRRKLRRLLQSLGAFLLLAIVASGALTACGGGPTTPAGAYSIEITAASGSITQQATFSLTVQ